MGEEAWGAVMRHSDRRTEKDRDSPRERQMTDPLYFRVLSEEIMMGMGI